MYVVFPSLVLVSKEFSATSRPYLVFLTHFLIQCLVQLVASRLGLWLDVHIQIEQFQVCDDGISLPRNDRDHRNEPYFASTNSMTWTRDNTTFEFAKSFRRQRKGELEVSLCIFKCALFQKAILPSDSSRFPYPDLGPQNLCLQSWVSRHSHGSLLP
jgi:hypothetical protein